MSEPQPTADRSNCNSSVNIPRPPAVTLSISDGDVDDQFEAYTVAIGLDEIASFVIKICSETFGSVLMNGRNRGRSVGTAMGYGLDGRVRFLVESTYFFSTPAPRPALGPTQAHIQCVSGALPPLRGYFGRGVKLTTHLPPVPSSRMVELYHIRLHGVMHD
jgi:hypothetical protein